MHWNEKNFFGKSSLGLDLTGCRYANMARLTNKAIFFKHLQAQCHFGMVYFGRVYPGHERSVVGVALRCTSN